MSVKTALDLTHVLYDDSSLLSFGLALFTLSPILLVAAYASLSVVTREYLIITMWAGQMASEAFNWILKHIIKEDRPLDSLGEGYGFPSSHSQWMGYFSSFLVCHIYFRHRFSTTGYPVVDRAWRMLVYAVIIAWGLLVAYSRFHLGYHSLRQIAWGYAIGVICGTSLYIVSDLLPRLHPTSVFGRVKGYLVSNPLCTWLQIRDGWAIWHDAGREDEWRRWRAEWDASRKHKIS